MQSNDELEEVNIKNHTCYYFNDIIKFEDFGLDNILINGKSQENVFVYNIQHKGFIGAKPLCIKFNKINGFLRVYD